MIKLIHQPYTSLPLMNTAKTNVPEAIEDLERTPTYNWYMMRTSHVL